MDLIQSGQLRGVSDETVKEYAATIKGCKVWELSALKGINVDAIFQDVAESTGDNMTTSTDSLPMAVPITNEESSRPCC